MATETVKLRMKFGDREFEAEGSIAFVEQMLTRFDSHRTGAQASHTVSTPPAPAVANSGKSLSLGEFIRQIGVTKHTDLVLAFGYYLEKYKGMTEFSPADINACYYETKREASNTSQAIIQNMRSGRLMQARNESGARAKYVLTASGEQQVQSWISPKPE